MREGQLRRVCAGVCKILLLLTVTICSHSPCVRSVCVRVCVVLSDITGVAAWYLLLCPDCYCYVALILTLSFPM